jgi:hypothetical protein
MAEMKELRLSLAMLLDITGEEGSDGLSVEDIRCGYNEIPEFGNALKVLGIQEYDIDQLFYVMDLDGSGRISLDEFCKECYQLQCSDVRSLSLHTRILITTLNQRLEASMTSVLAELKEVRQEVQRYARGGGGDAPEPRSCAIEKAETSENSVLNPGKDFNSIAMMGNDIQEILADIGNGSKYTDDCQQRSLMYCQQQDCQQPNLNEAYQQDLSSSPAVKLMPNLESTYHLLTNLSNISSACLVKLLALQHLIEDYQAKRTCAPHVSAMSTSIASLKSMFGTVEIGVSRLSASIKPLKSVFNAVELGVSSMVCEPESVTSCSGTHQSNGSKVMLL